MERYVYTLTCDPSDGHQPVALAKATRTERPRSTSRLFQVFPIPWCVPKLNDRVQVMDIKPLMRDNIVRLLRTSLGRVNVKARTHEKVDSVGEGRAMACHVVVLLEKVP